MASSFSTLGIELIATGEASGLWGDKTNVNLQMFQEITSGYVAKSIAGSSQTTALSITNATVGSDARQAISVAKEAGAAKHAAFHLEAAENYLDSAESDLTRRAYHEARKNAYQAKMKALDALQVSEEISKEK